MGSTEKRVEVPDDLKVLLPEENKEVIVVGPNGYELTPMPEGIVEKVSKEISDIMVSIYNNNAKCPKCKKEFPDQLGVIEECPDCKVRLQDCRTSPVEAILSSGKIPRLVELIIEIPANIVQREMTIPQMKHFAGVFWKQNLSDDSVPEESRKNLEGLRKMFLRESEPAARISKEPEKDLSDTSP